MEKIKFDTNKYEKNMSEETIKKVTGKEKSGQDPPNQKEDPDHGESSESSRQKEKKAKYIRKGYTKVPNYIIDDQEMNASTLAVIVYLYRRSFNKGKCWPSWKTIINDTGLSKPTVWKSLKWLKKNDYIQWQWKDGHLEYFLDKV